MNPEKRIEWKTIVETWGEEDSIPIKQELFKPFPAKPRCEKREKNYLYI